MKSNPNNQENMNHTNNQSIAPSQPMPLLKLSISTSLLLHPDFAASPDQYALSRGVELVNPLIPETDFKKDSETKEKTAYDKFNIHLVRYKAIRLRVECKGDQLWVCSIKLNPSLLLYDDKHHPLVEGDLDLSLQRMREKIEPLLADSLDSRHIVPGYCGSDEPIAFWSKLEIEVTLRGIDIHCLHDLRHPEAGMAHGTTEKRLQLGADEDDIVIRFEECTPAAPGAPETTLSLCLRRGALEAGFHGIGRIAKVKNIDRLVDFNATDILRVVRLEASRISGRYLPVQEEWAEMGKPVTCAKTIALIAELTDIPLDEIRAMDEEIRHASKKTHQRLYGDVPAVAACMKPIPVASLFASIEWA